jgi:formylglycine-generating enzyme required for sulfatase activity/predicted Ser/Thr protein kinase
VKLERVSEIFLKACELDPEQRAAFLDEVCQGDPEARVRLEALLARDAEASEALTDVRESLLDRTFESIQRAMPRQIGPYQVLEVLGEGGMGVVYRARQDVPNREVALKIIQPLAMAKKSLRRFEHEVEVLGRLQHPGIAQIYAAGTFETSLGRQPYFAMELVNGRPLLEDAEARQLGTRERLQVFSDICEAVHHAHQKGVIHRDLKPANILVDGAGRPRILDFGIARATSGDMQTVTHQTDLGQIVGTVAYMSPEQAGGNPDDLDTRSDVYSLGVILYELLTGQLPYDVHGKILHEAVRVIREEDPTPISAYHRFLRGDVETIVQAALTKEKDRRYQSALDLAGDLRRYLKSEPILARPSSAVYQLRKFATRNKVLVGSVVTIIVTLATGLTVAGFALRKESVAREEADEALQVSRERLADFTRLADVKRLQDLQSTARTLWPVHPDRVEDIQSWLQAAHDLARRLPVHQSSLLKLREGAATSDPGSERWTFERMEDDWMHEQLNSLVADLQVFTGSDPRRVTMGEMEQRLAAASTILQRSIMDHGALWEEAITDITLGVHYDGLEIEPQVGLVPIGTDAISGLWEFWHVESGTRPVYDRDSERLLITGDTGIVLVLLPGGTFWMGAQREDPQGPNYDPGARIAEPPHEVALAPFFLSKFEMTQGQWQRLLGENPSSFGAEDNWPGGERWEQHPIEQVSWSECREALFRLGLVLPTEAQWEYGARGGRDTPWWCGTSGDELWKAGNLADHSHARDFNTPIRPHSWNDGFSEHAPVGSFEANPFGLHDTIGNVFEWCRDRFGNYSRDVCEGDGLRVVPEQHELRNYIIRGGGFDTTAADARSAVRKSGWPESPAHSLGVRPARALDP